MSKLIALKIQDLFVTVQSGGAQLIKNLSLSLAAGERLTFVGESGSGKSILAQAIMGTLPSDLRASGSLQVWGVDTYGERQRTQSMWGKQLIMLPQEPWLSLNPLMRVQPQVAEAAHYAGRQPWPQAQGQARSALAKLGLTHACQQWPHQISGGMAQRTALAAAQLCGAQLLIADEPTKGLDTAMRDQVAQMLLAQTTDGRALLTITHDLALAGQLGGQIAVMLDGCIVELGAAEQVLHSPQHAYTQALVAAQPAQWPALSSPLSPALMAQDSVIEGQGLAKAYGQRILFSQAQIALRPCEVVSIAGPSGCGKTTLGNLLLGLTRADSGQVVRRTGSQRHQFQKLYQDPPAAFAPSITLQKSLHDVIALHRLDANAIAPLMQKLKLSPALLARKPAQISGGELQRFAMLRLLLLKPIFIFADEPTSRLDPITQLHTMQLLCNTAAEQGCAVLLVTHDADIAAKVAHRVSTVEFSA